MSSRGRDRIRQGSLLLLTASAVQWRLCRTGEAGAALPAVEARTHALPSETLALPGKDRGARTERHYRPRSAAYLSGLVSSQDGGRRERTSGRPDIALPA